MKQLILLAVSACVLATYGCAKTSVYRLDADLKKVEDAENVGIVHYPPVPHLLVTRPQNKDGATETKIIYLPDLEKPLAMRFRPGFGSSTQSITLVNGMLSTFNQTSDTQLDELLANLTAPVTGLATAEATRATAGLTDAQAAALMEESTSNSVASDASYVEDPCGVDATQVGSNSQLTEADKLLIGSAYFSIRCAAVKLKQEEGRPTLRQWAETLEDIAHQLLKLTDRSVEESHEALLFQIATGKAVLAPSLRYIAKALTALKIPDDEEALKPIRNDLRAQAEALLGLANRLDPPGAPPKSAFELYRIMNGKLVPVPVGGASAIQTADD